MNGKSRQRRSIGTNRRRWLAQSDRDNKELPGIDCSWRGVGEMISRTARSFSRLQGALARKIKRLRLGPGPQSAPACQHRRCIGAAFWTDRGRCWKCQLACAGQDREGPRRFCCRSIRRRRQREKRRGQRDRASFRHFGEGRKAPRAPQGRVRALWRRVERLHERVPAAIGRGRARPRMSAARSPSERRADSRKPAANKADRIRSAGAAKRGRSGGKAS